MLREWKEGAACRERAQLSAVPWALGEAMSALPDATAIATRRMRKLVFFLLLQMTILTMRDGVYFVSSRKQVMPGARA